MGRYLITWDYYTSWTTLICFKGAQLSDIPLFYLQMERDPVSKTLFTIIYICSTTRWTKPKRYAAL
jgi:hypothetical protein